MATMFHYTVNRLYKNGTATDRLVINLSNQDNSPSEARHYGRLISRKTVPEGEWRFAGVLSSPIEDLPKITQVGGLDQGAIQKRAGIDLSAYQ